MKQWTDELADWMNSREKIGSQLEELSEEVHQTVIETDSLLRSFEQLQTAYTSLMEKVEHVSF